MRLLKKIGSMIDAKKAPVLMVINATETFEVLIAKKKVIQCKAMITPPITNFIRIFLFTTNDLFESLIKMNRKTLANNILNQTKGMASIEISAPKIAVNPQIKIIK